MPKPREYFKIILLLLVLRSGDARKRAKRLLYFPPKSNLVMTMALLKLFPTEKITNTLTEFDALFPLPLHPFHDDLRPRRKRELERSTILSKLKEIGDHFGFDGNKCLINFLCKFDESISSIAEQDDNVLRDIIDIIFEPSLLIPGRCLNETRNNSC